MLWLRSLWRSWKQIEKESDLKMGRDERYWIVRNDATRIGALTIPFTIATALLAGAVWLPDPIGKEDVLQLGLGVHVVSLLIALVTRHIVMERKDVGWVNPSIDPYTYLALLIFFSVMVFIILSLIDRLHGKPFDWVLAVAFLVFWAIFLLVYTRRWRRDKQNRDD